MVDTIIKASTAEDMKNRRTPKNDSAFLNVAECYYDTIQGENFTGVPATFLRLQSCTLACVWCDTIEVWRYGEPYAVSELIHLFELHGLIERFKDGQNLIVSGGSPMLQQESVIVLFKRLFKLTSGKIQFQFENECTLMPSKNFWRYNIIWNNSPKLEHSGMSKERRYKPEIIKYLSSLENSWFKFVIQSPLDWREIQEDFLDKKLIKKEQIVLMPLGKTREEVESRREMVVNLATSKNVRFTDRLHITIWDKKTGV